MKLAVIGTSRKENEKRVAIHPQHLDAIAQDIRRQLYFEKGYGEPFDVSDNQLHALTGNQTRERASLLGELDAVLIPKPVEEDFLQMREGTTVWGWIHSVQQEALTQIAIQKRMTLIAWENMHASTGRDSVHVFNRNNEMAGYCGVQHALELRGIDVNYGKQRKIFLLGFGATGRGAVHALLGHGFHNITICTRRTPQLVANKIPRVRYVQMFSNENGKFYIRNAQGSTHPMIELLADSDIIINTVLQNPLHPTIFIRESDLALFRKNCLIIDISCDHKMGFFFAEPTTLEDPLRKFGNIHYYGVDHTPTLMWDSASWEISECLLPYLADVVNRKENPVIRSATDMENGIILNTQILSYQGRAPVYPFPRIETVQKRRM